MADFSKRNQSDNAHLANQTSALFEHIDGGKPQIVLGSATSGRRLLRIVNNTKGLGLIVRTGSRVVASLATTSAEGPYPHGVYCEGGITVDVSGTGSATLVYEK